MNFVLSSGAYLTDLVLYPFEGASLAGLLFVSVLLGVALVWAYGKVSAQSCLKGVKDGIAAALYEAVLYRHDLRLLLAAQGRLFSGAGRYLALAAPPLLILALPCIVVLAGLNDRYETRGLQIGEGAQVDLRATPGTSFKDLSISGGAGVTVSQPVRQEREGRVSFWVQRTGAEDARVSILLGAQSSLEQGVARAEMPQEFAVAHRARSIWLRPIYPRPAGELSAPFQSLSIGYPLRQHSVLGFQAHWLLIFLVASMIAGLIGSRILKIEI